MKHELLAEDERRQRLRTMQSVAAIALWGAGCGLIYLAWSMIQSLTSPLRDSLSTALYLVTLFYIFAFWPIHSLVERVLTGPRRAAAGPDQKP